MTATVNGTNSGESQPKKSGGKAALIDRLGGRPAVEAAVDIFYQKVTTDDRIKHYFENTDMRKLRAHQTMFMMYAFGGPNEYKGRDLAAAHRHLLPRLTEEHFNAVAENFIATLKELNVPQEEIDDAVAIVASAKDAVLSG